MKSLFRYSLTTLMCIGTLITGTQSWAADTQQAVPVSTESKANPKMHEKCPEPCNTQNNQKMQHDHSQHGDMENMSEMDHSKMENMDHSKMMDMDHSKMNMTSTPTK